MVINSELWLRKSARWRRNSVKWRRFCDRCQTWFKADSQFHRVCYPCQDKAIKLGHTSRPDYKRVKYKCNKCDASFNYLTNLEYHKRKIHKLN